jgi:hypothetical protein
MLVICRKRSSASNKSGRGAAVLHTRSRLCILDCGSFVVCIFLLVHISVQLVAVKKEKACRAAPSLREVYFSFRALHMPAETQ